MSYPRSYGPRDVARFIVALVNAKRFRPYSPGQLMRDVSDAYPDSYAARWIRSASKGERTRLYDLLDQKLRVR